MASASKSSDTSGPKLYKYVLEKTEGAQGGETPSAADITSYLLKAGLDYKGQFNYAFQQIGLDATLGITIDPLKLAGISTGIPIMPSVFTITPKGSLKGARHRLLAVEYQSDKASKPVALQDMRGFVGTAAGKLGFALGPQVSLTKDIPGLEAAGISFSVSATLSGNAGYDASYLRVSDPIFAHYKRDDRSGALSSDIKALLQGGDRQGTDPASAAAMKRPAWAPFNPLCSFTMCIQNAEASASLDASAGAKVDFKKFMGFLDKFSFKASATAGGPKIERKYNWSSYRLQTKAADGIVMTQDAEVTVKKTTARLLKLDLKGEAAGTESLPTVTPYTKTKEDLFELEKRTKKIDVNAVSYRAAVLYWDSANPQKRVDAGSGIHYGHSVSSTSLFNLFSGAFTEIQQADLVLALGFALKVDPEVLWKSFFRDKECQEMVAALATQWGAEDDKNHDEKFKKDDFDKSYKPQAGALFIEASFQPAALDLDRLFARGAKEPAGILGMFAGDDSRKPGLESIRLRYRISDKDSKTKSLINLGVSYAVDFKLELNKFEQYGSAGWVDLFVKNLNSPTVTPATIMAPH